MLKKFAVALLGMAAFAAIAQSVTDVHVTPTSGGYVQDARGNVMRSSTGLCWRTGFWQPGDAIDGCDGALTPPIAQPTAPALVVTAAENPATAPLVALPAATRCDSAIVLASDASFAFGKAVLTTAAKARLDGELRQRQASCDKLQSIKVTGHTDRIGSVHSNRVLSEKRATAIAAEVRQAGLTVPVEVRGVGSTVPLVVCNGKLSKAKLITCLAPNRRATIEFNGAFKVPGQ